MDLRYGDKVSVDDPLLSSATRAAVESVAGRHGLLVGNEVPVTAGVLPAGTVRVVVSRTTASVPGCPDWSTKSDFNFNNATSRGSRGPMRWCAKRPRGRCLQEGHPR